MLVTEGGGRTPGFTAVVWDPPPVQERFAPRAMPAPTFFPGDYAVPGLIWPGFMLPGEPVTGAAAASWLFTGNYTCIYPQHINSSTEFTLVAQPGGAYDINPAAGNPGVSEPPGDGRWIRSPL